MQSGGQSRVHSRVHRKVQRKSTLIAENVERFTVRVLRRRGIIFPLIEKRSGLLAFKAVVVEAHAAVHGAVHGKDSRTLLSPKQSGLQRRQLLKLSYASVHALHDSC